jgi:hypothetical protein
MAQANSLTNYGLTVFDQPPIDDIDLLGISYAINNQIGNNP